MKTFNRYTASALHLAASIGVVVTVLAAMRFIWYPSPYFESIQAGGLILILAGVDVTLGPLLTLIVFNLKKPELKRDLSIVVLLQIAALAYGMHVVFAARPVYAVFNVDRFDMVTASEIDPGELAKATREEFRSLPLWGPRIIAAHLPSNKQESGTLLFSTVAGGADVYQLPKYYVPYEEAAADARHKAKPLAGLRTKPSGDAQVNEFVASSGMKDTQLGYVPFRGAKQDFVVVLELETGRVAGFLPINPY